MSGSLMRASRRRDVALAWTVIALAVCALVYLALFLVEIAR